MRSLLALLLAVLLPGARADAQDARVRAVLQPPDPAWVGQELPLTIELLAPNTFAGAPSFDLPELPGALIVRIGSRPTLATETIAGTSYSVQRHRFAVFGQRAGKLVVPAFSVRFGSRERFDAEPEEHRLETEPFEVELELPPGAEDLATLVSTTALSVTEAWKPPLPTGEGVHAMVGDAFTRTITITAPNVPGMLFPPLPLREVEGLGAYPAQPAVKNATERGAFTGTRIERVTYVCEREGSARIPALVLTWWRTDTGTLEREELAAVTLTIDPNPALAAQQVDTGDEDRDGFPWAPILIALLAGGGVLLGWTRRARVTARFSEWQRERADSEPGRFAALSSACRSDDAATALNALYHWLQRRSDHARVATLTELVEHHDDGVLASEIDRLQQAVLGSSAWSGAGLLAALRRIRIASSERAAKRRRALPPLNPVA